MTWPSLASSTKGNLSKTNLFEDTTLMAMLPDALQILKDLLLVFKVSSAPSATLESCGLHLVNAPCPNHVMSTILPTRNISPSLSHGHLKELSRTTWHWFDNLRANTFSSDLVSWTKFAYCRMLLNVHVIGSRLIKFTVQFVWIS